MAVHVRRSLALVLVAAVVALGYIGSAEAGSRAKTRTVSGTYLTPSWNPAFRCSESEGIGCVRFVPEAGERFIHVEVHDTAGMAVYAYVNQDWSGDGTSDIDGAICGETNYPLRIVPGVPVNVFILPTYTLCSGAVAMSGTVEATLGSSYRAVMKASSD